MGGGECFFSSGTIDSSVRNKQFSNYSRQVDLSSQLLQSGTRIYISLVFLFVSASTTSGSSCIIYW